MSSEEVYRQVTLTYPGRVATVPMSEEEAGLVVVLYPGVQNTLYPHTRPRFQDNDFQADSERAVVVVKTRSAASYRLPVVEASWR